MPLKLPVRIEEKAPRRPLLWIATATLPFAYIPHEIVRSGPNFAIFSLALILLCGFRYGAFRQKPTLVDAAAIILGAWIFLRLVLFGPLEVDAKPPAFDQALTDIAPLVAGVTSFRLGRIRELRGTFLRGLTAAVVIMLVFEVYQLVAGVGRLMSLGYVTPLFNYYTEAGAFRPFSTFLSPTVFGGYLAMVGVAILFVMSGGWRIIYGLGIVGGLALTYTRASWIAFTAAALTAIANVPARTRGLLFAAAVPLSLVVALLVIMFPEPFAALVTRFDTVTDSSFSSNSIRIDLWEGVLAAVGDSPLIGYGMQPFSIVMQGYVGAFATFAHAHNNFLQEMFLYGIPGFILFILLILAFVSSMKKAADEDRMWVAAGRAALTVFVIDSFFEATWGSFNVAATLFLLVGLGSVPITAALPKPKRLDRHTQALQRLRQSEPAGVDPSSQEDVSGIGRVGGV